MAQPFEDEFIRPETHPCVERDGAVVGGERRDALRPARGESGRSLQI